MPLDPPCWEEYAAMLTADQPLRDLKIRFRPGLRLSDEVFWRLCCANPDLNFERTARGDLEIEPLSVGTSALVKTALAGILWNWNEAKGLGRVFGSRAGFTLPNSAIRSPDLAWIPRARRDAATPRERDRFVNFCPDFVAEVHSFYEGSTRLRRKMREYIDNGARLGWHLDPNNKDQTVEVYRPGRPPESLTWATTLSGEDVLPGFALDLAAIGD